MVFERVRELAGTDDSDPGDAEDPEPYECGGCGERYAVQHHVCPECDSFNVEAAEW